MSSLERARDISSDTAKGFLGSIPALRLSFAISLFYPTSPQD